MRLRFPMIAIAIGAALSITPWMHSRWSYVVVPLCDIVEGAHVLAEVEIRDWDSSSGCFEDSYYTPVYVEIREVLWGELSLGVYTVWVPGGIKSNGEHEINSAQYRRGNALMFLKLTDGQVQQADQGYFWSTSDSLGHEVLANGARYPGYDIVDLEDLIEAQAYAATGCPIPDAGPMPDAQTVYYAPDARP